MFSKLEVVQTALTMARHAGSRQAVIARNIANADTPGYRAREIAPFKDYVRDGAELGLTRTRAGHMAADRSGSTARVTYSDGEPSPNGNSVSLEQEMVKAVEVERDHNRALTIYRHSLDVLRMSIGRR